MVLYSNMKNISVIVGALLFIGIGGWFLFTASDSQSPEETPNPGVSVMESTSGTEITTQDGLAYFPESSGFLAEPSAPGDYPGVVMIHENRGLRPEVKQAAEELAREGYRVLAVDLYKGTVMETQEEARAYRDKFNQAEGLENMQAAVQYLKDNGSTKIASLGWCFGGKQSVDLAISGTPLDATVVYYGGGMATSTEQLAPISWPVLGIFGDQDAIIPVAMVRDFETSLDTLGIENEVYLYEGVGHAFANPSNSDFAPEATEEAWARTLTFLETHLGT